MRLRPRPWRNPLPKPSTWPTSIRLVSPWASSKKETAPSKSPGRKQPSLLEELFPEYAEKTSRKIGAQEELKPEVDLTTDMSLFHPSQDQKQSQSLGVHVTRAGRLEIISEKDSRRPRHTLLVLQRASKALTPDDFFRVIPQGQHIRGWRGQGGLLKVAPARDPGTLRRLNFWFLHFASANHAKEYQDNAYHLHKLARENMPTSVTSKIAPPPGYIVNGEDVYTRLQEYTLAVPSQELLLVAKLPPLTTSLQRLLDDSEAWAQAGSEDRKVFPVRISTDLSTAPQLNKISIENLLRLDGEDRAWDWEVVDGESSTTTIEEAQTQDGGRSGVNRVPGPSLRPYGTTHWLINFTREAEARRFVRSWHRKSLPHQIDDPSERDYHPVIDAECMW